LQNPGSIRQINHWQSGIPRRHLPRPHHLPLRIRKKCAGQMLSTRLIRRRRGFVQKFSDSSRSRCRDVQHLDSIRKLILQPGQKQNRLATEKIPWLPEMYEQKTAIPE
jgi:hypothetical protein